MQAIGVAKNETKDIRFPFVVDGEQPSWISDSDHVSVEKATMDNIASSKLILIYPCQKHYCLNLLCNSLQEIRFNDLNDQLLVILK